jgi:hypothetical protein
VQTLDPMWLDAVVLLPLLILGLEALVNEKKIILYISALTMVFITNYYIGYMTGIFTFIYFLYYYFANREELVQKYPLPEGNIFKKAFCAHGVQTFGRFVVKKENRPVKLVGRAKEILALVITRRGREISNEEIYSTVWEDRTFSNDDMSVYYNAIGRLRRELDKAGIGGLLISNAHGQMADTSLFDCDYYDWLAGKGGDFNGEFMSEYSWSEEILAALENR